MNTFFKVSFIICCCLTWFSCMTACSPKQPADEAAKPEAEAAKPEAEAAKPANEVGKAAIQNVVKEHSNELRGCYESALNNHPGLKGRLVMTWVIDSAGAVSDVTIKENRMNNKEFEDCITSKLGGWKFEGLVKEGKTQVEYPFDFETNSDEDASDDATALKDAIQKVVGEHSNELRSCYESALDNHPGLKGRLVMTWAIDNTGAVSEVTIKENGMNNKEVEDCIVGKLSSWKFEGLVKEGKTQIEYPFTFETNSEN